MSTTTDEILVLHVDDEPNLAELVAEFLEREDDRISVKTATSASSGLERVAETEVDCIISDYDMPGQNGIEFLETLREKNPDLPFILYTGKGSEEVASDAISAGATDYLQKGSDTEQYELLANRVQNAVEQYRAQKRAEELERIRTLRSDINSALIRADSWSEAETRVCEIISDSDPYLFAWIGEMDSETGRLKPKAWAGVEDGYLDDITVTADDTATGHGPGGTAIRERRVAVSQNVQEDTEFEPWRQDALERGYQSIAAVPLEYEDTFYGALGLYSERPDAFDDDEKELVTELGADISQAYHRFSIQTKLRRNTRAMEATPIGITLSDPSQDDNPLIYVNKAFEELTGYDSEEIIGRNCRILQGEETEPKPIAKMGEAIDAEEPVSVELRNYRKDGTMFWNRVTVAAVENDDGEVTNYVGFQEDITTRKKRESRLQQAAARLKSLFDNSPDMIDVLDSEGTILEANKRLCEELGYDEDELPGTPIWEIDQLVEADDVQALLSDFEQSERRKFEGRFERKDGSTLPVEVHLLQMNLDEEKRFVAVSRDITERKEHERELEQARQDLREIIDLVPDLIFSKDREGEYLLANQSTAEAFGMTPEEMEGKREREIIPDQKEDSEKFHEDDREVIKSGESKYIPEERLTTADGETRIFQTTKIPYQLSETGDQAMLGYARDVTELKQYEQQLTEQRDNLETLNQVVRHDIRNSLQMITAYAELVQESVEGEEAKEYLERIVESGENAIDLTENARDLADTMLQSDSEEIFLQLDSVIEEEMDDAKKANPDADIQVEGELHNVEVRANEMLPSVFKNLFENAVRHNDTKRPEITVSSEEQNETIQIRIADNGPGVPNSRKKEIFGKGEKGIDSPGTGIGLYLVNTLIDQVGGDIWIEDNDPRGAVFVVELLKS